MFLGILAFDTNTVHGAIICIFCRIGSGVLGGIIMTQDRGGTERKLAFGPVFLKIDYYVSEPDLEF